MIEHTKNRKTDLKNIHPGLAIFKTGRSPYWHARIYNNAEQSYRVRSTRETGRYHATKAAIEIWNRLYVPDLAKQKRNIVTFSTYADRLSHMTRQRTKGTKSYAFKDQYKILYRKEDGLVAYFGDMDVRKIKTGRIRSYLAFLDQRRLKPLAPSTKAKQCIVLRQTLELALEDGVVDLVPQMPKIHMVDKPRPSFTEGDYKSLLKTAHVIARLGRTSVRGVRVTLEHVNIIEFAVQSFLRPTDTELFGIRFCDVVERAEPKHLELTLHGKTGFRISATLEAAVAIYQDQKRRHSDVTEDDFVFMPAYKNRTTAVNSYRRVFNHFLAEAGLKFDKQGNARTPYSLRHYALQSRLAKSEGKANIYWLASNAGTSVEQLERFYLKGSAPSAARVRNIQSGAT